MTPIEAKQLYQSKLERFEQVLRSSFPTLPQAVSSLEQSMKYSLFAGGKRIRPILLLSVIEAADQDSTFAMPFACAIEYIYTYSLIHDDLPCMDDDQLRRGKPTNHVTFGEDIALLAGDALLTHSFNLISSDKQHNLSPNVILRIIQILSYQAGIGGMVTGQVADIANPDQLPPKEVLTFIHSHKTGALITSAIQIGALLAQVDERAYESLSDFGVKIGNCFQIQDDILDDVGDEAKLGKTPGTDKKNDTLTYPSVYGLERSKELARESHQKAISSLKKSGLKTDFLEELAGFVISRSH